MADMAITGAIHKPITTYAAPTAAEQQGAAATQTAEKTQKSRFDTVEISGKMQAVTKRATTIFGERIEQGDNESADEYHERVKTTLAKKCNEYYTKLFNGTLTEEERLPSTMELLQNRKPLVAKQMAGESDDAFMRRKISYDTSNAWHDHLLKTLTATTGMPMGESLREKYGDTAAITGEGGDLSQLSGEELAALEQEMQLSGQSQVMWGSYTKITIEMSFSSMEELEAALGKSVDILCAARQAQSDILPRYYGGEELSAQRDRMEELFRASLEKMSDAFMGFVGGFLDRHGAIGQGQEMGMSVRSLYASYQSKYAQISEQNSDPTGTAGTKDAWLSSHFGYLTSSLLRLGKGIETPTEEGRYSLIELQFAAMSVTAWHSSITKAADGTGGSEVRQALSFSMVAMKIEFAGAQGTIGSRLSDTLTGVQDSVSEALLDAMDAYQEKCRREKPEEAEKHPAADRELFRRTCKRVMDHYHKTGDAVGAIREGAARAKPELEKAGKERGRAERWDRETEAGGYWDRFQRSSPYGESGMKDHEKDWSDFKDRYGRRDNDDKRGDFSRKA